MNIPIKLRYEKKFSWGKLIFAAETNLADIGFLKRKACVDMREAVRVIDRETKPRPIGDAANEEWQKDVAAIRRAIRRHPRLKNMDFSLRSRMKEK